VKDHTWLALRQHGMVIEEDADDNGDIEKYEDALAEKLALQLGDLAESRKSEK